MVVLCCLFMLYTVTFTKMEAAKKKPTYFLTSRILEAWYMIILGEVCRIFKAANQENMAQQFLDQR